MTHYKSVAQAFSGQAPLARKYPEAHEHKQGGTSQPAMNNRLNHTRVTAATST